MYTDYGFQNNDFEDILEEILDGFSSSSAIGIGIAGIFLVILAVCAVLFVIALAKYIVGAIPLYNLAKKTGSNYAWCAWIPLLSTYFRIFLLSDISGKKDFSVLGGKIKIENRISSFWIYVAVKALGGTVIASLIAFLNFIPFFGQILSIFAALLYLLPSAVLAIIEYAYLRDVINVFKPDKKANSNAAITVCVLDHTITFGFAKVVYLYTLMKLEPLPQETVYTQQ